MDCLFYLGHYSEITCFSSAPNRIASAGGQVSSLSHYFYISINSRNYTLGTRFPSLSDRLKRLTVLKNDNTGDEHCKSSVSIAIMSWHVHKNIVMRAVNLYNEFAWAQENFDAGG